MVISKLVAEFEVQNSNLDLRTKNLGEYVSEVTQELFQQFCKGVKFAEKDSILSEQDVMDVMTNVKEGDYNSLVHSVRLRIISQALFHSKGSINKAALLLKCSRPTIRHISDNYL